MEIRPQGVPAGKGCRDAVNHRFRFFLERTEQSVPNDERSTVVTINVDRIPTMVHSVMRRRVENPLERPQPAHELGMDPKLVQEIDRTR